MATPNDTDVPAPPPSFYQRNEWLVDGAAIVGSLVAIGCCFLLWHGNVFWKGSVNQAHALCSAAGSLVVNLGPQAVSDCSAANTDYLLLIIGLIVSVLVALGGIVVVLVDHHTH